MRKGNRTRVVNDTHCALLLGLCLVLFGGQDGALYAQGSYKQSSIADGGSIEGTVLFAGTRNAKLALDITKDQNYCGKTKPSQSLVIGKNNGVQNAVVYLEGITEGKRWPSPATAVLDQHGCQYTPHVSVIPAGQPLEIVNDDPILHNVHLYNFGSVDQTICNIAQPVKGQRTKVDQLRTVQSRFLLATCDAGHPWMSAYVVRADNPYFAVTDANGRFRLDNIPPGAYKLTMWHEGVAVTKTLVENGKVSKYYFEEPYVTTKDITVSPRKNARVDFQLTLRRTPG